MKRITQLAITLMLALGAPGLALAAGGGGAPIVLVADTRKLTGIMAWWANLYNESHLYFTILTVILIPLIGVIFGVLADIIMHWIGLDLKSRELAEH
ncbi:DVU0150 family protein [Fundidesulfovibrio soli]|uniref:DVU0150 family protein n=1 Tax=Fundidesulfovibrio soli TaxID=2922716 RepID=UPI001FAEE893|nr:DVU0150 family protein [Fundidesulfovibrio soli]